MRRRSLSAPPSVRELSRTRKSCPRSSNVWSSRDQPRAQPDKDERRGATVFLGERAPLLRGAYVCVRCLRRCDRVLEQRLVDCTHSRADRSATPGCRVVMCEQVEQAIAERLLEALAAGEIALALKA